MNRLDSPAAGWFFDLDGTLIDSAEGILACLRFALRGIDAPAPDESVLRRWIGPPLRCSFGDYLGPGDPARIERAVALYLQHMDEVGWREYRVFDGVPQVLEALRARGSRLCVVTAKVETYARRILAHSGLAECFGQIVGATADGRLALKADLIGEALRRTGAEPATTWMVGDRNLDIEGALAHGMRGIGVLWGIGSADELRQAGAWRLVSQPAQWLELPAPQRSA